MKRSKRSQLYKGRKQPSIYSRTEENVVKKDFRRGFLTFLLFALVVGLLYFLFFSPFFRVEAIELGDIKYGDKAIVLDVVNSFKDDSVLSGNIITFRTASLAQKLKEIEWIKNVEISKAYPHKINVKIDERTPALVWQVIDRKYLVDESGAIWGDYDEKFSNIPVVIDQKNIPVEVGKKVVSETFTRFVTEISQDFEKYTDLKIAKIEVSDSTEEIKVTTSGTWYANFDATRTAKNQLINLNRILTEVKAKKKTLEYVDLRIDNRIFYK